MPTRASGEIPSEASVVTADAAEHAVVLLVDDQPIVAEALRQIFASEPAITFHYCQHPSQALAMAIELDATVILQDLVMPEADGMALVRAFRGDPNTRSIPVIVLSSREEPKGKSDAFGNGASDYLVKIPDPIELVARVRLHSRMHRVQRERDDAYQKLATLNRKLEESNTSLAHLSAIDDLTQLPNRRCFDQSVDAEWRRAARTHSPLSLILLDVDYFKRFNDGYGHLAGDECLRRVAAALKGRSLRGTSMVARYGGEEFVAMLPDTTASGAGFLAEMFRTDVEALGLQHAYSEAAPVVTISLGAATSIPEPGSDPSTLLACADQALYAAKREGRNRFAVHHDHR